MRTLYLLLLLILPLASLQAVDVEPIHKRDTPVVIKHDPGDQINAIFVDASGEWKFLEDKHFLRLESQTIMAGPAGQYLITSGGSTIIKIVEEGKPDPKPSPNPSPRPDPEPQPDPQPDPPDPEPRPEPKLNATWAVWIYEQADAINEIPQTNTRLSIETRRFLDSRGIKIAAYDDDQQSSKAEPFRRVAGELPALVLLDDKGKNLSFPAPTSLDQLKSIIAEVKGE